MIAIETRPLHIIASEIRSIWVKPNFAAVPYIRAMERLNTVNDNYGYDNGKSIIRYFLGNASTWTGEDAKRIKTELKAMLK